jgi:hypothetical protein
MNFAFHDMMNVRKGGWELRFTHFFEVCADAVAHEGLDLGAGLMKPDERVSAGRPCPAAARQGAPGVLRQIRQWLDVAA